MSGYENSPDCGGPGPSWREVASVVLVIVIVLVAIVGAVWALRRLLLLWAWRGDRSARRDH